MCALSHETILIPCTPPMHVSYDITVYNAAITAKTAPRAPPTNEPVAAAAAPVKVERAAVEDALRVGVAMAVELPAAEVLMLDTPVATGTTAALLPGTPERTVVATV